MSSTRRKAEDDETLHQQKYASSSPFSPPLLCNLVARRAKSIRKSEDRALVYYLQQRSHAEGNLECVAEELLAMFPERIGTPSMHHYGIKPGYNYIKGAARSVRRELGLRCSDDLDMTLLSTGYVGPRTPPEEEPLPVDNAVSRCRDHASCLADHLREICLNPKVDLDAREDAATGRVADYHKESCPSVLWFHDVIGALHLYRKRQIEKAESAIAETEISRLVFDDLNFAAKRRVLVVTEGAERIGKSYAAKNWCDRHPGQAVYVKLGVGNDDASFFRSIARALGTASSLTRKPTEMQMKIEDALQEGHLVLVLDEAHFLFAQTQRPRSAPSRLDWIRTALSDFNVGVVLISTPQFDRTCDLYEKQLQWNAAQLRGRVKQQTLLPPELSTPDLLSVARFMAPNADEPSLFRLVGYAQSSDAYLAGIDRLVSRATYYAECDDRVEPTCGDIKRALDNAMPRPQAVEYAPAPAPKKKQSTARATQLHRPCKEAAQPISAAPARRPSMDPQATGYGASERLQFTEAAATE